MDPEEEIRVKLDTHNYAGILHLPAQVRAKLQRESVFFWEALAHARLCTGDVHGALSAFKNGQQLQSAAIAGSDGYFSDQRAALLFMLRRNNEAVELLEATIRGLTTKTIIYADAAGGVSHGLLLWLISARGSMLGNLTEAKAWLSGRVRRKAAVNWPGPLASCLLGVTELASVIKVEFSVDSIKEISPRAEGDLWTRRKAIKFFFYLASLAPELTKQSPESLLYACALLENSHCEPEWYLARHELGMELDCKSNATTRH